MAKELATTNKKALTKGKAQKMPSKRTMNFVHHQSSFNASRMVPIIILMIVVAAVFVKFGILDFMDKKMAAYDEVGQKQQQLSSLNKALADYDAVFYQYGRYSYGWMNETETGMVNRMDILKLIEQKVGPASVIENMSVTDNVLTMNIHGLTLEEASTLVNTLESDDLVDSATVYSAVAEKAGEAKIFLSVNLIKEAAENEDN